MIDWKRYNEKSTEGKYLIRFLSEKNTFKFLKNGEIWFSRADKFGDKMECVTIDDLKAETFDFMKVTDRKQRHLISCWHNVGRESIAMWDASYRSPEKRRVYALKLLKNDLIDYIVHGKFVSNNVEELSKEKLYGKVIYKNLIRDSQSLEEERMRRAAFRKEYSFEYEKEFRFVVRGNRNYPEVGYALNIGDPEDLDFSIMINPLLEKEEYKMYLDKLEADTIGRDHHKDSELVKWLKPLEW